MKDIVACVLMLILFLLVAYILFSYNNAGPRPITGGDDLSSLSNPDDINPALKEYYKKTFPISSTTVVQLHYADWCNACKTFLPAWNKLAVKFKKHSDYQLIKNDQDKNEVPGISTVPAIIKYKNGVLSKFSGKKDIKAISKWIKAE